MDLSNPWLLMSGLFIGLIGLVFFNHGRREANLKTLGTGVILFVYPYFISSVAILWGLFAVIMGGLYAVNHME